MYPSRKGDTMGKKSNLVHECKQALHAQCRYGESKHQAKIDARKQSERENIPYEQQRGIYSTNTYKNYELVCNRFIDWILKNHKTDVKHYSDCLPFAKEWLQEKTEQNLSAWSIRLYASALASSFGGLSAKELNFDLPARERKDIVRNREDDINGVYKTKRQREVWKVLISTGCRRTEMLRLKKEDFRYEVDENGNRTGNLEVFKDGKGGVKRWCLVNPKYSEFILKFIESAQTYSINGEERLFLKKDLPRDGIHSARAVYAQDLYEYYEEHSYATGELYHCRKELAGYSYDKGILEKVSYNLQHGRNNVVINYLWLKQ